MYTIQNANQFFSKNFTISGFNVPQFVGAGSKDVMTFNTRTIAQEFINKNVALRHSKVVLDIFSI